MCDEYSKTKSNEPKVMLHFLKAPEYRITSHYPVLTGKNASWSSLEET